MDLEVRQLWSLTTEYPQECAKYASFLFSAGIRLHRLGKIGRNYVITKKKIWAKWDDLKLFINRGFFVTLVLNVRHLLVEPKPINGPSSICLVELLWYFCRLSSDMLRRLIRGNAKPQNSLNHKNRQWLTDYWARGTHWVYFSVSLGEAREGYNRKLVCVEFSKPMICL